MNDIRLGLPSASSALADSLCLGRVNAQRDIPEWQSNEYASFGSLVHLAYEGDEVAKMNLTDEQSEIVRRACEVSKKVSEAWADGEPFARTKEQRLWDRNEDGSERSSGQYDTAFFQEKRALIEDLKSLYGEIPSAPKNLQLRDLAALVYINREALGYPKLKEVSVFINQPLATMSPVVAKYGKADLERAVADMRRRVDLNMDPNAPRVAGVSQCKYCRAKLSCPVALEFVNRLHKVNVLKLNPVELSDMLDRFAVLGEMEKAAKEYATMLISNLAGSVPNYALNAGKTMRNITDYAGARQTLLASGHPTEKLDSISDMPLGRVADLLKEKNPELTIDASKNEARELLAPFITETTTKPSLVRVKE